MQVGGFLLEHQIEEGIYLGHGVGGALAGGRITRASATASRAANRCALPLNPLPEIIRAEMARSGPMPFARFMELALYHPEHGYYERDQPVGVRGDFVTSVSIGPLFGEALAAQFAAWLREIESSRPKPARLQLIEAGAHDGTLASDVLTALGRDFPDLSARVEYVIVEPSPRRAARQQEKLAAFAPLVRWLESLPAAAPNPQSAIRNPQFSGILFSNELLDAFPVHRIGWDAHRRAWFEWGVEWRGDKFDWTRLPLATDSPLLTPHPELSSPELQRVLPDQYTLDLCPAAAQWWRDAAQSLARGWLVAFDYGFTDEAWLRPERPHGTLRAIRRHHANPDVLDDPGGQDLTAHVNFSEFIRAGEASGLQTVVLQPQAAFLTRALGTGGISRASAREWSPAELRQFHSLTNPEHLGAALKVLVQRRTERVS
jgi:SAM-dependent MidA family methyltransferase